MTKERRLGRGLEALLGRPLDETANAAGQGLVRVNVYELDSNPFQPRREFDEAELESLASSIREHGLLQPVAVRRVDGRYQLIAGERRLRAAIKAGWAEVPAHVIEADDRQVAELAIVENLQRKDLNPLEKAASFQQYLERYGCTQEELAGRLTIDRSTVANLIRLLELPETVQDSLRKGTITAGHARALLPLGDEREQVAVCKRIDSEGLSVRVVEALVQEIVHSTAGGPLGVVGFDDDHTPTKVETRSEHLASLEQEFRTALGTQVELRQSAKGKGKLTIHFKNHDEFERIRRQLCGHDQSQSHAG